MIINLKNVLSIMENNNMEEYLSLLTSKDNISTTIGILEHSGDIQNKIREQFVRKIQLICEELDYQCEFDNGVINCANNSWIRIWDEKMNDVTFRIGVDRHSEADGFRMDFIIPSTKKVKTGFNFVFWSEGKSPTLSNPIGWDYLWGESGKSGSGRWWRWDDWNTLRDMTNGKMIGFVRNTLYQIKEQDVFKRINESLENNLN